MKPLRILLADDHELLRRGLRVLLEEHPGWEVCGEADNGREAVELALRTKPNIAILDHFMPELTGVEAMVQIRSALPEIEVLILTVDESEALMRESINAGARGYVLKSDSTAVLLEAVDSLSKHRPFFTARVSKLVLESVMHSGEGEKKEPAELSRLSPRELEVVQLIAEGKSNKQIALALGISPKTAENHRTNMLRKLNMHSATQLVRYAIRNRLINP